MSLNGTQWINVTIGILDVFLMTGLTFIVDGFDSPLYWVFPVLILHNALAIPLALPQILLNLLVTLGYVAGGVLDQTLISGEPEGVDAIGRDLHLAVDPVQASNMLMASDPASGDPHRRPLRTRPRPRHLGRLLLRHPGAL